MNIKQLEVILKLTSRCNINCTYCYYFYGADQNWQTRRKKLSDDTLQEVIRFLKDAINQYHLTSVQIDFHGGEPLLYGKQKFEELCQAFQNHLGAITNLRLAIQTNAMLIDSDWVQLFEKFNVSVAISLDGPEQVNDKFRVDHKGRGTYQRVLQGLRRLQVAQHQGRIQPVCNLAVINPYTSGQKTYRHMVDELKIYHMDFLLPGDDYDTYQPNEISLYGDYLIDVLNEWIKDDNPDIQIRLFNAFIARLHGQKTFLFSQNNFEQKSFVAMTIDSDGMIYGDDSLRSNQAWNAYKALPIESHHFDDFLATESQWYQNHVQIPDACSGCIWQSSCAGGQLENRYSSKTGYNNPTIYCDALQRIYQQITQYLVDNGLDQAIIEKLNAA